jgi:hypothetical protein
MASQTSIINRALRKIGQSPVSSIDDGSPGANAVKGVFGMLLDELSSEHPFDCVRHDFILAAESDPPLFGWTHQFRLPPNPYLLRVWIVSDEPDAEVSIPYKVMGRRLLCNVPGPLYLQGLVRVADMELLSPWVAKALAARIAAAVAYELTNSTEKEDAAEKWAEKTFRDAKSIDAQQGKIETGLGGDFERSRR